MSSNLAQIARQTGVSMATVSLALRDKGRMSQETRDKVKAAAEALNYHVHPLLSRAFSIARRSNAIQYRETLAFLIEYPMDPNRFYQQSLFDAARESASKLGYLLEPFLITDEPSDQIRVSHILRARGIRGLIIVPRLSFAHPRLHFEWEHFAAVQIYRTIWNPPNLHYIASTDYEKVLEAMHLLKKVGYKRIGMAIEPPQNNLQRGTFVAAYLVLQAKVPVSQRIPPLLSYGPWNEATFRKWMARYNPDVLYVHQHPVIFSWIKKLGLSIPEDISVFCENVQEPHLSGLRRDYVGMGQSAVEMISILLGNDTLGLPGNPRSWHVDEFWQVGASLKFSITDHVTPDGYMVR